jgi:hypothetical protein
MVPNLQKWWNIEEKFLWPNRDLNPGTLKCESGALWPTSSEPLFLLRYLSYKKWFSCKFIIWKLQLNTFLKHYLSSKLDKNWVLESIFKIIQKLYSY